MKITRFITAALIASLASLVSSPALLAEEDDSVYKLNFSGGFNFAHGHAHDMTQKTWGGLGAFTGEFGVEFKHPYAQNVSIRPNFGMTKILSGSTTEENPLLYDLMGLYFGFDLAYSPFDRLPVTLSTGPSFHVWNVDMVDTMADPNQGNKGVKFGWRLGVSYDVNSKCRVGLSYTFTEWRTLRSSDANGTVIVPGFNPSRPAYFCLKATYIF
jgi:opacity protein-like surface antigen